MAYYREKKETKTSGKRRNKNHTVAPPRLTSAKIAISAKQVANGLLRNRSTP